MLVVLQLGSSLQIAIVHIQQHTLSFHILRNTICNQMRCMCFYASPRTSAYAKHYSSPPVPFSSLRHPSPALVRLSSFLPSEVTPRANTHRTQQAKICVLFWIFSHFLWVCVCVYGCVRIFIWLFSCFFRAYIKMEIEYFMWIFANSTQLENKRNDTKGKEKMQIYSIVDIYLDIYYIYEHICICLRVSLGCCKNCHQPH